MEIPFEVSVMHFLSGHFLIEVGNFLVTPGQSEIEKPRFLLPAIMKRESRLGKAWSLVMMGPNTITS